jgi:AcrR family transcriptional regulator
MEAKLSGSSAGDAGTGVLGVSTPGTRERKGALLRQAILEAAERRLGDVAFESIRVCDIVRDVGVTDPTFFNHFEGKGDLLEFWMARFVFEASLRLALDEGPTAARLRRLFARTAERMGEAPRLMREAFGRAVASEVPIGSRPLTPGDRWVVTEFVRQAVGSVTEGRGGSGEAAAADGALAHRGAPGDGTAAFPASLADLFSTWVGRAVAVGELPRTVGVRRAGGRLAALMVGGIGVERDAARLVLWWEEELEASWRGSGWAAGRPVSRVARREERAPERVSLPARPSLGDGRRRFLL